MTSELTAAAAEIILKENLRFVDTLTFPLSLEQVASSPFPERLKEHLAIEVLLSRLLPPTPDNPTWKINPDWQRTRDVYSRRGKKLN